MTLSKEEQLELLEKSKSGDIESRNKLCLSFYPYIEMICKQKCKNTMFDAEDFISECFIKILKSINNHNPEKGSFKLFVNLNVSNHIKDISHRYHGGPHRRMKDRYSRPYITNFSSIQVNESDDIITESKFYEMKLDKLLDEKTIVNESSENLSEEDRQNLKDYLDGNKNRAKIGAGAFRRMMRRLQKGAVKYKKYLD